jgi:hypothetical protein
VNIKVRLTAHPAELPVGSELRTHHGTRWVKVAENKWHARGEWGTLDKRTVYRDDEVYGELLDQRRK